MNAEITDSSDAGEDMELRRVIKTVVVDDQALFATGLAYMLDLDPGIEVVGIANDGFQAVDRVRELKPDVVLMDVKMPRMDGITALKQIKRIRPNTKVILLTIYDQDRYVFDGLKSGADGYLLKDSEASEVVDGIVKVMKGNYSVSPHIADQIIRTFMNFSGDQKTFGLQNITDRELSILKLLAQGKSNKQIAYELRITDKTVRNHISSIYRKLHVYGRTEAAMYAFREGLLDED